MQNSQLTKSLKTNNGLLLSGPAETKASVPDLPQAKGDGKAGPCREDGLACRYQATPRQFALPSQQGVLLAFFLSIQQQLQVWHQAHILYYLPEEPLAGCGHSWEVAGASNPSREHLFWGEGV